MYNRQTEALISNAPQIDGIDRERLPQMLADAFAQIASIRFSVASGEDIDFSELQSFMDELAMMASTYETYVSVLPLSELRNSAAFVAGTAHQLLFNIDQLRPTKLRTYSFIGSGEISSDFSAMLLFLISNNPSDASETVRKNQISTQGENNPIIVALKNAIRFLAESRLQLLSEQELPLVEYSSDENGALDFLWMRILQGIRLLADELLVGSKNRSKDVFEEVKALSQESIALGQDLGQVVNLYSGPHHLATLLSILAGDLMDRGIVTIPPPTGVDASNWGSMVQAFAKERPILWDNHSKAVALGLLEIGTSAVITFPTGAGKSTLSELKIGATLLAGMGVVYLVPTHALGDQIKENFRARFNIRDIGSGLRRDSEYSELGDDAINQINVLTPERCLALVGINPELFAEVGLVVFDECHLMHGEGEGNDRRGIDAMLCILNLFEFAPDADMLLISAMVSNGEELADWISKSIGRNCLSLQSDWKPTRQIRGCLVYPNDELTALEAFVSDERKKRLTKNPGVVVKRNLFAKPYGIFSLKMVWETKEGNDYRILPILPNEVLLGADKRWRLTANRVQVASKLAANLAFNGIKTLVFTTNPRFANSGAMETAILLEGLSAEPASLTEMQKNLIRKARIELGNEEYVFKPIGNYAGVHHGLMLVEERILNESLFKTQEAGTGVLFATPTLAQGINLPAEVVIIAGDDRYDPSSDSIRKISAQELLNAAGRAGRAGQVAQGVVIVIPGNLVGFEDNVIGQGWWDLKKEIFSSSDQCLKIVDPIDFLLDKIHLHFSQSDEEQTYILNKIPNLSAGSEEESILKRSFARYQAVKAKNLPGYQEKLFSLFAIKRDQQDKTIEQDWKDELAYKMGLPVTFLIGLADLIRLELASNDASIEELKNWFLSWLVANPLRLSILFRKSGICSILGLEPMETNWSEIALRFDAIRQLSSLWISGATLEAIQLATVAKRVGKCERARKFTLRIIPELSFACGLVSQISRFLREKEDWEYVIPGTVQTLATCVKEGFDLPTKLAIGLRKPNLTRIECHQLHEQAILSLSLNEKAEFKSLLSSVREVVG